MNRQSYYGLTEAKPTILRTDVILALTSYMQAYAVYWCSPYPKFRKHLAASVKAGSYRLSECMLSAPNGQSPVPKRDLWQSAARIVPKKHRQILRTEEPERSNRKLLLLGGRSAFSPKTPHIASAAPVIACSVRTVYSKRRLEFRGL